MAEIISVHSFRGGTGKSNLIANLATIAARHGKRVGIVDTDIQSPGIHVIFGLDEDSIDHALNDYLWGNCTIEAAAHDVTPSQIAKSGGQVILIPSSIRAGEIARVLREGYDVGLLTEGFRNLVNRLDLDYLFIDTHPGLNEETLLSIAISNMLLLILRPDKQDFQGTAVTVKVASRLGVPKMRMMVNKALTSLDFDKLREQVEGTFDVPVVGIFAETPEILELGSSGLFCLHFPDHLLTQEMERVTKWLLETKSGKTIDKA